MKEKISLLSTFINVLLAIGKAIAGLLSGSVALIAEAIHSGLDIFSSTIPYFGIKEKKKPADKEHPYGYYNAETVTSFIIAVLLFATGVWIIYEGVGSLLGNNKEVFTALGLIIMGISAIVNEIMARVKLHYGQKENSLPLISDAEHSKVDVWASLGVFVGLFATKYYPLADGIIAIGVGLFILYETYGLSKEIVESFLDVRDEEVEKEIKELFSKKNTKVSKIKSRKIGGYTSAEIKINLDNNIKLNQAEKIIKELEKEAKEKVERLKYITITFEASGESYIQKTTFQSFGGMTRNRFDGGGGVSQYKKLKEEAEKKGEEIVIIPLKNDSEIAEDFGADKYLKIVLNVKDNKLVNKSMIKNEFVEDGVKRGGRFIKKIGATKIIAKSVGEGARDNFKRLGIEIEITKENNIEKIVENITKGGE